MSVASKKISVTFFLIVLAALSCFSQINRAIENTFFGRFDKAAEIYLNESLKRALYTFAVVRGGNGVISVIQNTAVSASPAGVGVNLAAGEILDPVNDLFERFSWVMLVSATSLGIQKILLSVGKYLGFDIFLTLSLIVLCLGVWVRQIKNIHFRAFGIRLLMLSLAIRFCMPAVGVVGAKMYDLFLKETFDQASQTLDSLNEELKKSEVVSVSEKIGDADKSVVDAVRNYFGDAKKVFGLKEKIENLRQKMADYADYTVNLIIVFTLQTIIFPIFFLWFLMKAAGALIGSTF